MSDKLLWLLVGAGIGIAGTIVSSGLLWWVGHFWRWLHKPTIRAYVKKEAGSISRNPTIVQPRALDGQRHIQTRFEAVYGRVLIENERWCCFNPETAKKVSGYLADLRYWDATKHEFVATQYTDFLQLAWSHSEDKSADIFQNTPHWLDVFCSEQNNKGFFLGTLVKANRYETGFERTGFYRFTIQLSGENVGPQQIFFYLRWSGNWEMFEIFDEQEWPEQEKQLTQSHQQSEPSL